MATQRLYHMVLAADWRKCIADNTPYYPQTYAQDGGFIHLTADPQLLLTVANHFYVASQGDWLVLVLDTSKLSSEVKFEPAAPVGDTSSSGLLGQRQQEQEQREPQEPLFPHLYGTIDFDSVVGELPMQRGSDGSFLGIQGLP